MNRRVIIIQHESLTPNILKRFSIQDMLDAKIYVLYWDISQLIYPGITFPDVIETDYVTKINNYEDLMKLCGTVTDNDIIIPEFFFIQKNKKIWEIICSTKAKLIKFERYANANLNKTTFQKIIDHLDIKIICKSIQNFFFRKYAKYHNLRNFDILITSSPYKKYDLLVNHTDYDNYLLHKDNIRLLNYKYICFVDTGFGIHPDEYYYEGKRNINNELWQNKLCLFFSFLEQKYNYPVVIATHPKIKYDEKAFGGRKKIKFETLNLVLNSEFVLQDGSAAISFSIMAGKQIGIIATDEMINENGKYISGIAKAMNLHLFALDKEDWNLFKPSLIPEKIRKQYIHDYLCADIDDTRTTSEKLIRFLNNI